MHSFPGIVIHGEVLTLGKVDEYLRQLIRGVVVEMDGLCETTLQSRVRINEVVHLISITCHDTNELATVILQSLQQGVNRLTAKGVIISRLQRVGLINEQHTTHCRVNQLVGLDSRLTRITGNQFTPICLHQLSSGKDTKATEHIRHDTGDRRLTRTGITCEDIMLALEGVVLTTAYLKVEEGGKIGNFLLDSGKTDHTVQFLQTLGIVDSLRCLIRDILLRDGH